MTFLAQRMAGRRGTGNWFKHDRFMSVVRCCQYTFGALSVLLAVLRGYPSLGTVMSLAYACAWGFLSGDRLPPKERRVLIPAEAPSA